VIWFSLIVARLSSICEGSAFDDPYEVLHTLDHTADLRRVGQRAAAPDFIEAQADKRRALLFRAPLRAVNLRDGNGFSRFFL
jgi:hypothetical protein